jgi:diguanylate cyclase (GGDEF)-like protein
MPRSLLRRLTAPDSLSPRAVQALSLLAVGAIFVFDIATGADIRLHVLYLFPLAAVALHCPGPTVPMLFLGLTTLLQMLTFAHHRLPTPALATDMLVTLASSLLAIVLARAARSNHLHVRQLADKDPLTGLLNRRSFTLLADREIARQERYGGNFSIAIIDLDDFKALNDAHGHQHGDRALQEVAGILQGGVRETDAVARLGGDEFAILMPNTGEENALHLCRSLAAAIEQRAAPGSAPIAASIGCASFEKSPGSTSHALNLADKRMYQIKAGRKERMRPPYREEE